MALEQKPGNLIENEGWEDLVERSDWDPVPIRYLCRVNPDSLSGDEPDDWEISYVDISAVNDLGEIENPTELELGDASSRANRLVQDGDVIVSTVRTYLKAIGLVRNPPENRVVSTGFAVLRPKDSVMPEFLWRSLQAEPFVEWIVANSKGVSYPAIAPSRLADLRLPVPSRQEQENICSFLDHHTARIDQLIEKKQRLLELLEEKRQAVISETVTQGIDPGSPLRPAPDWIGETPAHWETPRVRYVARLESGHTPSKSVDKYWEDCHIPWVTTSDINQLRESRKVIVEDTEYKLNEAGLRNSGARLLPEGTVFLSRTASVGFSGIMGTEMATSQDFANWVPGPDLMSKYLLYCFRAMGQEFERLMQGSTHQTIYMPEIRQLRIPLPPVEEQREIVSYLEEAMETNWELTERIQEGISLLQEKRQALITAAVTGQIDVTDWEPPQGKDIQAQNAEAMTT